ncbi:MAG: helix-turn-helix domain-containing protein [Candidatus Omnitrophota bacterium]|nr:helix-turn-helix domain-containing protein [Candidatus Omnitrophota bacterium]
MDIKNNDTDKIKEALSINKNGETYHSVIGRAEKVLIENALELSNGNQIQAAKMLGINRNTLRTKVKTLGICMDRFKR